MTPDLSYCWEGGGREKCEDNQMEMKKERKKKFINAFTTGNPSFSNFT